MPCTLLWNSLMTRLTIRVRQGQIGHQSGVYLWGDLLNSDYTHHWRSWLVPWSTHTLRLSLLMWDPFNSPNRITRPLIAFFIHKAVIVSIPGSRMSKFQDDICVPAFRLDKAIAIMAILSSRSLHRNNEYWPFGNMVENKMSLGVCHSGCHEHLALSRSSHHHTRDRSAIKAQHRSCDLNIRQC